METRIATSLEQSKKLIELKAVMQADLLVEELKKKGE